MKGKPRLKARNFLHGNRDKGQYSVRRDSVSADLSVFRLVLSLGVILGFSFGTADVKGVCVYAIRSYRMGDIRSAPERICGDRQKKSVQLSLEITMETDQTSLRHR